jgi:hypothetical protein
MFQTCVLFYRFLWSQLMLLSSCISNQRSKWHSMNILIDNKRFYSIFMSTIKSNCTVSQSLFSTLLLILIRTDNTTMHLYSNWLILSSEQTHERIKSHLTHTHSEDIIDCIDKTRSNRILSIEKDKLVDLTIQSTIMSVHIDEYWSSLSVFR